MFDQILAHMRKAVAADRVYLTFHANKELKADGLDFDDVINCILTGEIMEQQLEKGEDKYLLYGDARNSDEIAVVATCTCSHKYISRARRSRISC